MPRNTLVVGRDPELVNRLVRLIEDEREVRAALTGQSALLYMSQRPATTIVIDDELRDFSATDLAFHLRALAETQVPPRPCCLIAFRSDLHPESNPKMPGFDYVLTKPEGYLKIDQLLKECDLDLVRKLSQP